MWRIRFVQAGPFSWPQGRRCNFLTTWRHPNKWQISGETYRRVGGEMDGWAGRRIGVIREYR
jgi:hypothetical protein